MNYTYPEQSYLSKTLLAGAFAGIAATLANLAYDLFFRSFSQFAPSQIINVATIIFATMLLCVIAGIVYFFVSKLKQGQAVYIVLFGVISVACVLWAMQVRRSPDAKVTADFRVLLSGILVITGALATFFIPYLMKHQGIFLDEKDQG